MDRYEPATRRLGLLELRDVCTALGVPLVDFVRDFDNAVTVIEDAGAKQKGRVKAE